MNEQTLKRFAGKTIYILRETVNKFEKPCLLWSMGKDSTLMLYLARMAFPGKKIPFDVVHIDTKLKFPEMYEFRDKLTLEWYLNLKVATSIYEGTPGKTGHEGCCTIMKTNTLKDAIKLGGYDAVIVGIRWDEHGVRGKERYMSPRDKEFKWNVSKPQEGGDSGLASLQDPEMSGWDIFASDFKDADHVRVHPILHWDERSVWEYIKWKSFPVNQMYFDRGNGVRYRSLGCMPCTEPIQSDADTIDKIIEELEKTKVPERAGRVNTKEENAVMQRLREWGYM